MQTVSEMIEAEEAAGTATPADVAQAERDVAQAAEQVTTLERRVVEGDEEITPDEIEKAKSLRGFAKLRAEAIRRKAERTARAKRLRAGDELRAEIEAYTTTAGPRLVKLLRSVEKAIDAFTAAVDERNQVTSGYFERMRDLGVPNHDNPLPLPSAEHAHLGIVPGADLGTGGATPRALAAGRRRVPVRVDADAHVTALIEAVRNRLERDARLTKLYDRLDQVDEVAPDVDPTLRFFRSRGGQVIQLGHRALTAHPEGGDNQYQRQIAAGDLVEISRREAWGE